jgi:small subunit ribosomal protein S1
MPAAAKQTAQPTREDFAAMLEESFGRLDLHEGSVVKGKVVGIEKDIAVIDIGLKTEGRVPVKEFAGPGREAALKIGDEVEVYLERVENALGEAVLSRDKARREESWGRLEKAFQANEKVTGVIFNQVKGGYTVDLDGAVSFLPRSQVDIRPIRDIGPLMHTPQQFQILKMDRRRGNIVVSRRTVLEETRAGQRHELVSSLEEGQTIDGVVKNITDYGAFVDLGGIDGLLHVTDIAWRRVNHPNDVLSIGQQVKVRIIKINHETHRISLGMQTLQGDPGRSIETRYPVGTKVKAVTNITTTAPSSSSSPASRASCTFPRCPGPRRTCTRARSYRRRRRSRCRCSRSIRSSAAFRWASSRRWPIHGRSSPRSIRSARRWRARSRTRPSSACSSASTARWTAWCT